MFCKILDFICENWELVSLFAVSLLNVFITLIKKKVVIKNSPLYTVLKELPRLISQAEKNFEGSKSGESKFAFVYDAAIYLLNSITGEELPVLKKEYGSFIATAIEDILSTPEKKEV